jgi:hypothetical protein
MNNKNYGNAKSENSAIPCVTHHGHNSLESAGLDKRFSFLGIEFKTTEDLIGLAQYTCTCAAKLCYSVHKAIVQDVVNK